jgi:hypothetical protein
MVLRSSSSSSSSSIASNPTSSSGISSSSSSSSSSSMDSIITSSTLANYATKYNFYQNQGVLNDSSSLYMNITANYTWGVEVWGMNCTAVNAGSLSLALNGASGTGSGRWYGYGTPLQVANWPQNCTIGVLVNMTCRNSTGYAFYNTSTQTNLTATPCINSGDWAAASINTAGTALYLNYPNTTSKTTEVWMPPLFNATFGVCPFVGYNISGLTVQNLTATPVAALPYCQVNITKTALEGNMTVIAKLSNFLTPFSISGTALGAGAAIIVGLGAGYVMLKRRK